jgi:hypothetical protein
MVGYHWIDNLPVGQHHDQKLLRRLFSAFLCYRNVSLAIPERVKLPNELWRQVTEIATAIAATIMDKRIKTIF